MTKTLRFLLVFLLLPFLWGGSVDPVRAADSRYLNEKITICIPTYNSERTLRACVEEIAKQGRYQFLIYDNGSVDGTRNIIQDLMKTHDIKTRTVSHQKFQDKISSKIKNIALMRAELVKDVKTPYLFFLDSDVILSEPIEPLISDLAGNIGMVGYAYEKASHVQMGATMLKTSAARKIDWNLKEKQCECLNARDCLDDMGLKTMEIAGAVVRHDKRRRR